MPVPTVITDLNVTAALNSPPGSENVFPSLDDYMRASNSFIAQLNANKAPIASPVFTGVVSAPLGTALLPSYTFTGDLNNGWWSPAADVQAWSAAGVERLRLDGAALLSTVPVIAPLGTALLPSYSFTADPNTGGWSPGADIYAVSTAGVERYRAMPTGPVVVGSTTNVGIGQGNDLFAVNGAIGFSGQLNCSPGGIFQIVNRSNLGVVLYPTGALASLSINATGNVTIPAPSGGTALAVAGLVDLTSGAGNLRVGGLITRFESSEQTTPSATGSITVAHGSTRLPDVVQAFLRCKITELGYAVGDEVLLHAADVSDTTRQSTINTNATNLVWRYIGAGGPPSIRSTTNTLTAVTVANWRVVFKALWL